MRLFTLVLSAILLTCTLNAQEPELILTWEGEGRAWESGTPFIQPFPEYNYSNLSVYTSHPDSGLIKIILPTSDPYGYENGLQFSVPFDYRTVFPLRTVLPPIAYIDSIGTGFVFQNYYDYYVFPEEMQWIYSIELSEWESVALGSTIPDENDSVTIYEKFTSSDAARRLGRFPVITAAPRMSHNSATWLLDDSTGLVRFRIVNLRIADPDTILFSHIVPDSMIGHITDVAYLEIDQSLIWYFIEVSEDVYNLNLWRVDDDNVYTLAQVEFIQPPRMICAPRRGRSWIFRESVPDWNVAWVQDDDGSDQICWFGADSMVHDMAVEGQITQFRFEQEEYGYTSMNPGPGGSAFYVVWSEYSEVDDSTRLYYMNTDQIFDVDEPRASNKIPEKFEISNVYPNPFNSNVTISISLPARSDLKVTVFNIHGQQVAAIANGKYSPGYHPINFDASNFSSGIYFINATVPERMDEVRKVVLLR
ncbi:MAG: T9SS type A sorting domain-containing protein [Candidatus Electryonea clarkiae]|nr:T9SS type A sorting domain-containing protein [Candidatus Electryonea clarkiae]MDP8286882.1 T9SS type A sorting domain-containing protein [Candidatus Electryonea clarkiae]